MAARGERVPMASVDDPDERAALEDVGITPSAGGERSNFVRIRAEMITGFVYLFIPFHSIA